MRYLHTMVRVADIDASLDFYVKKLGLKEVRRMENQQGRYTLIFLAAPEDEQSGINEKAPLVELTYNWDPEDYKGGRNFGHLAYEVDNIYDTCKRLMDTASPSTVRRATATWPSSGRPTASRSSYCRRGRHWRRPSPGHRWPTPEAGKPTKRKILARFDIRARL